MKTHLLNEQRNRIVNNRKLLQQVFTLILVMPILVACGGLGQITGPTPTPVSTSTPIPTIAPTPDPLLAPEVYLSPLGGAITTNVGQDSVTASTLTASDSGVAIITTISVGNRIMEKPKPETLDNETPTLVEVPTIGDGSIAYTTPPMFIGGTQSKLAFIKGNVKVTITCIPLGGGKVPMSTVVELAKQIEATLPSKLPLQPIIVGSKNLDSTAFSEYLKNVTVGKKASDNTLTPTNTFTTKDYNYCLRMVLNKKPGKGMTIALYDEQRKTHVAKWVGNLSKKEAEAMETTQCLSYTGAKVGEKYTLNVWVDEAFVAEYPFEIR
jgi:hypothetical protein